MLRERSPFAQQLKDAKNEAGGRRPSFVPVAGYGSHPASRRGSRMPSRNPSYAVGSGRAPQGGVPPQQVNKRLQAITDDDDKAEGV